MGPERENARAYLAKYHPRAEPTLWYIKPGIGAPSGKVAEFLKSYGVAVTRITETLNARARAFSSLKTKAKQHSQNHRARQP